MDCLLSKASYELSIKSCRFLTVMMQSIYVSNRRIHPIVTTLPKTAYRILLRKLSKTRQMQLFMLFGRRAISLCYPSNRGSIWQNLGGIENSDTLHQTLRITDLFQNQPVSVYPGFIQVFQKWDCISSWIYARLFPMNCLYLTEGW